MVVTSKTQTFINLKSSSLDSNKFSRVPKSSGEFPRLPKSFREFSKKSKVDDNL